MKAAILNLLSSHPWKDKIHYFETIDSTNNEAKRMALEGAPHGTVLIADQQTGGRGRMGRSFHSPAGKGLYLSVILRPQCHISQLMHLTCAAGLAAYDAVYEAAQVSCGLKWINDLVFGQKKLGGILAEPFVQSADGQASFVVIGIGINCNHRQEDFPPELRDMATSLAMITEKETDRCLLAAELIRALETMSRELLEGKATIMERYHKNCVTLGKDVSLIRGEEVRYGHAEDIDEDGGLIVRFPDGHREAVSSGEVSVRGMYGYIS